MTGYFSIRLNYFKGSAPTVATVIVRMGTEYVVNLIQLNEAIGEDGNANPPHKVAIFRVTNDEGVFTFGIVN